MYLKSIKIKNFRKIEEADCFFNPGLNLIIGPNDSGKTAIVDAIRLVLKQIVDDYFRISEDHFNDKTQEINIDLIFSFDDCEEANLIKQSALFAEYLSFTTEDRPELRVWFNIKSNENDIRFPSFKVGPTKDVAVDMDARCRENLKIVYLRPLRDAETELKAKQGSRISKILHKHKSVLDNENDLIKFLTDFKESSEGFFDTGKGNDIKSEVERLLKAFDEQGNSQKKNIKFGPTENVDSCLKTLEKLALYYEDLPRPGLGTLNMIFIAAELLHLDIQPVPKLLLVEEIEAHLHPQRQLKIIKALQEESKKGIQMILTTHSPNLASVVDLEHLKICYDGKFYSLAKSKTQLDSNNYSYLGRFLDVTKSNLFFAQGVILVEGSTEQLLIPELAKIIGYDLTDFGISVVSINNLGFDHFINIFKRKDDPYNKIPIAVITDSDKRSQQKIEEYSAKIKNEQNNIDCFVSDQLSSNIDISKNRGTTFEKIILSKTSILKQSYIDNYNKFKKKKSAYLKPEMDINFLYSRIERVKAPLAQEVAQQLVNLSADDKGKVKIEVENNLKYIVNAIKYVLPKQNNYV